MAYLTCEQNDIQIAELFEHSQLST